MTLSPDNIGDFVGAPDQFLSAGERLDLGGIHRTRYLIRAAQQFYGPSLLRHKYDLEGFDTAVQQGQIVAIAYSKSNIFLKKPVS